MSERPFFTREISPKTIKFEVVTHPRQPLVALVENLIGSGLPFVIHAITDQQLENLSAPLNIDNDIRAPIIGSGVSYRYFPFISDPQEQMSGKVAVLGDTKRLIYTPKGARLHQMRDSFIWAYSLSDRTFYTPQITPIEVVGLFIKEGYQLYRSPDMVDFAKDRPYKLESNPIEISEIGFRS